MRKPPGLGRTYHHGTFHRVVWCCTGAEEERYLDLTLLNLSLDEPPTKGTRELEEQEREPEGDRDKVGTWEVVAENQQPECEPLLLFSCQVSQQ